MSDTTSRISLQRGTTVSRIFYPHAEKLRWLIESIHNREVALPDFQRDFVWDPRATDELLESICQNYPAGSLLRIKNSSGALFSPRAVAGAPSLDSHKPSYLMLDGQQRLTSLYQAFFGVGSHRYFIHLGGLIEGQDLEDCVFYERQKDAERKYGSIEKQAESLTFPFSQLFNASGGFEDWLDRILDHRAEADGELKSLKSKLRDLRQKWLKPVEEYEFPVVSLAEDTSPAAVCTIFETLNRTGVKLSVFDLLAARFWPENVRLREMWEQANDDFSAISEFEVDPYYVLQAISLVTGTGASCKRSDVLDLNVGQITAAWDSVVAGLAHGIQMLKDDCGVVIPKWLPYNTMLIPLAAIASNAKTISGPKGGAAREKLKRWFWCSVFGQAYERAPNSQSAKDYVELKRWIGGGEPPQTVQTFAFDAETLRKTTPRQRAVYRGAMALILRNGAIDFHSREKITAKIMLEEKIDDHHVFPQAYLDKHRPEIEHALRDSVLNRTLIDKLTNIRICKNPPSKYLSEIASELGTDKLSQLLASHYLPTGEHSPLEADDFDGFIVGRMKIIASRIKEVTS
jgi:hypothetical protein